MNRSLTVLCAAALLGTAAPGRAAPDAAETPSSRPAAAPGATGAAPAPAPAPGGPATEDPAPAPPPRDAAPPARAPREAAAPAPSPTTPAPAPAAPQQLDRVEVTAPNTTEERRQSTAAKIIVGREEIERYGDSTVGEVLRRLPGVTLQGAPGRGGRIGMRGMAGFTQILLDGQRVPPGFSLDSLNPEQIERIEILRAPTAETGTRAIAGTINIITREGYVRTANEVRLGTGIENGVAQPNLSVTRNDSIGRWIYNLSASWTRADQASEASVVTTDSDLASGLVSSAQTESLRSVDDRDRWVASGRLQYRLERGMLIFAPFLLSTQGRTHTDATLLRTAGSVPPPYAAAATDRDGSFRLARLNMNWRERLASGLRLEGRATVGAARSQGDSARREFGAAGVPLRLLTDRADVQDRSADAGLKASHTLGAGHALVLGAEAETVRRTETRDTRQDGQPVVTDFGDNLAARSRRVALYAQDEWNVTPTLAAHAGLRWEHIDVRGADGTGAAAAPSNRSGVLSPIAHMVWKPEENSRDQVRLSLTHSYRSPALGSLIARPSISARYPVSGPNVATSPDRAGNPALLPEQANGVDLAVERYLGGGGVLSANLFLRRLRDVIRSQTTLETVSWSPVPRWVARPQNIGPASSRGIELEAKLRLNEAVAALPAVDVRANASFYRSRVESVPGPDNRLNEQPGRTLNVGLDYRLPGTPVTVGGTVNVTPAYETRLAEAQWVEQGRKRVADLYLQWVVDPRLRLRLSASNLAAADYLTGARQVIDGGALETARTTASTYVAWRLRAEWRL